MRVFDEGATFLSEAIGFSSGVRRNLTFHGLGQYAFQLRYWHFHYYYIKIKDTNILFYNNNLITLQRFIQQYLYYKNTSPNIVVH
jgi:hypothetical protein